MGATPSVRLCQPLQLLPVLPVPASVSLRHRCSLQHDPITSVLIRVFPIICRSHCV